MDTIRKLWLTSGIALAISLASYFMMWILQDKLVTAGKDPFSTIPIYEFITLPTFVISIGAGLLATALYIGSRSTIQRLREANKKKAP